MHGQQVLHVQVGAQSQCRLHGAYIAHNHGRIFAVASWSNSIARFFAPTVRCSICDEDVASVRSNTALMGPNVWTYSPRWCAAVSSNCASATEASSISAMSGAGTSRVRSLSVIGTAPPTVESMCCRQFIIATDHRFYVAMENHDYR